MKDVYWSLFITRNLNHFNKFIKQQSISLFLMITYPWLRTRRRTLRWHSPPGTGASWPLSWVWRARCSISAGAPSSFWKLKSRDRWSSQKTFNFQVSLPHQLNSPPTHHRLNLQLCLCLTEIKGIEICIKIPHSYKCPVKWKTLHRTFLMKWKISSLWLSPNKGITCCDNGIKEEKITNLDVLQLQR